MKRLFLALMLVVLMMPSAFAGFDEGVVTYERKDYATALKEFWPLAHQNDARAQHNLAVMYRIGLGISQDYKEAVKWYRFAAEQGFAPAQNGLGVMYYNGEGVLQDFKEAVKWYRLAADNGSATAQNNLGALYKDGIGVSQHQTVAYALFNLAAASDTKGGIASIVRDEIKERLSPKGINDGQML